MKERIAAEKWSAIAASVGYRSMKKKKKRRREYVESNERSMNLMLIT